MTVDSAGTDAIDRDIIGVLRLDGRASWQALGDRVGLSANAAAERVRRLQRLGIIERFAAHVDPVALGRDVRARIDVTLGDEDERAAFEAMLGANDEVLDAVHLTGESDYQLTVDCAGSAGLDRFLAAMKRDFPISKSSTRVVLRQVC